jgi:hypothetical protein
VEKGLFLKPNQKTYMHTYTCKFLQKKKWERGEGCFSTGDVNGVTVMEIFKTSIPASANILSSLLFAQVCSL